MPGKFKKLFEPEMLVAISAIVVSLCALIVSIHESTIMRESQFAAVWPYMGLNTSFGPDYFRLSVSNDRIGPAKIKYIKFHDQDTAFYFTHNFISYFNKKDSIGIKNYQYSNVTGTVIRASETIELFSINDTSAVKNFIRKFGSYDFEICYCSVFDECWLKTETDYIACKTCPDL